MCCRGGVELAWGRLNCRAVLELGARGGTGWGGQNGDGLEYLEEDSRRRYALDETVSGQCG